MTGADAGQLARRISELTGGHAQVREADGAYRVELYGLGRNNRLGSLVAAYHSVEAWAVVWRIIGPVMEQSVGRASRPKSMLQRMAASLDRGKKMMMVDGGRNAKTVHAASGTTRDLIDR